MNQINWETSEFKIKYSKQFSTFRAATVTFYVRENNGWKLALPDMSPNILARCGFPRHLVSAARMVAFDQKTRVVNKDGTIRVVHELVTPPPKPKLMTFD